MSSDLSPNASPAGEAPVAPPTPLAARALAETRAWAERAVIGLNLCPFARVVQAKGLIRYAGTDATGADGVQQALVAELQRLAAASPQQLETTLLVLPQALHDFLAFNDFLALADDAVEALGLDGEVQVASFHPDYQFADAAADDITNATNRAPWPTLHLIREASMDRAVASMPDTDAIYLANMATLRQLGQAGWAALQAEITADAQAALAPQAGPTGPAQRTTPPRA